MSEPVLDMDYVVLNRYWTFQCNRCFIISGYVSKSPDDAPICCGGELMRPIWHEIRKEVIPTKIK